MKRMLAAVFIAAVFVAGLTGHAEAFKFDFAFDIGSDGITINFTKGPLSLRTQTVKLTGPDDQPQRLRIMPGLQVLLSIASIDPDKPQLTLHYVIESSILIKEDQEGDITLPFEHGYITNRVVYEEVKPGIHYDVYGSMQVALWRSNYALQFGLSDLNVIWSAKATPKVNEIHQIITRESDLRFADINLVFHPRLLYNKVAFNIIMTPQSSTWPSPDNATFTGTLPIPYDNYHFWFYRDQKN
jgi:hypothetical protein